MWYVCDVCLLFYYCIYWTSSLLIKFFQQFKSIINNFIPGDIAAVNDTVREIQNVLLTAASPCKVTTSNFGSNDKLEISP